ncbi:hypothetical protein ACFSX9_11170 [Flavobacterium ardleyense]|uniref:Uncharacterized protein n=1 Tax=Flavobacterium ardleyense TaxID=2038737 RepID=A0ABW5ZBX8_9FLAO
MLTFKKTIFCTLLFFISNSFFAQTNYEFFGIVKLNGDAKNMISYRINFEERKGKVSGYSITDLDGEHETKNVITGTYDSKTKIFNFQENEILYTKSAFSQSSFCFINYTGKIKLVNKNSKLEGDFKGMFKNKTTCINGTLTLVGSEKIYEKLNTITKKIEKSKKIEQKIKDEVNPIQFMDDLKLNKLTKNQNMSVVWEDKKIKIEIFDAGKEDGDKVNLYNGTKLILSNYEITNKKKVIEIELEKDNLEFTIEAISEGSIAPNTVKIILVDKNRSFELMTNLSKSEKAKITFIKKDALN